MHPKVCLDWREEEKQELYSEAWLEELRSCPQNGMRGVKLLLTNARLRAKTPHCRVGAG